MQILKKNKKIKSWLDVKKNMIRNEIYFIKHPIKCDCFSFLDLNNYPGKLNIYSVPLHVNCTTNNIIREGNNYPKTRELIIFELGEKKKPLP